MGALKNALIDWQEHQEPDDSDDMESLTEAEIIEYNLSVYKWWLTDKERELSHAKHLFSGRLASAVLLDPCGFKYPRHFYRYMLKYEPGKGLMPAELNRAYMGGAA